MATRGIVWTLPCLILSAAFAAPSEQAAAPKADKAKQPAPAVDQYGDPLPEGAIARLGTMRFRHVNPARIVYSPDGKLLASGSEANGITIWDAATGRPLQQIFDSHYVDALAFSPDSKFLVNGELEIFESSSGKKLRRLDHPPFRHCSQVIFSPDGRTVAAAVTLDAAEPVAIHYEFSTGKEIGRMRVKSTFQSIAFTPDSKVLAVQISDKSIIVWDVASAKELHRYQHAQWVMSLAPSPNGKMLASFDKGGMLRLWSLENGKLLHSSKTDKTLVHELRFSADGNLLILMEEVDGSIVFWDTEKDKEIRSWKTSQARSLALAPDGKVVALVERNGNPVIRRWDTATGKEIDPPAGHDATVRALQFAPDGKSLFACDEGFRIAEWDSATGKVRRQLMSGTTGLPKQAFQAPYVDLSADGSRAAGYSSILHLDKFRHVILVWDTLKGELLDALKGHDNAVQMVRFSPDGKLLASCAEDSIRLWDIATGQELRRLQGAMPQAGRPFLFSPDGKLLAWTEPKTAMRLTWNK